MKKSNIDWAKVKNTPQKTTVLGITSIYLGNLLHWTEKDADYVKSDNTEMCPFCKSTAIYSGSWAPETCSNCGAQWMIGIWRRSKHGNH